MRAIHYAAIGLVVALGACGKSGDGSKAGGGGGSILGGSSGAATIQPGLWETTSEAVNITAPGLPPGYADSLKGRKSTHRNCITPEEAAHPLAKLVEAQKERKCDFSGLNMAAGRVQGTVSCAADGKKQGKMTITMNGQYDAENYVVTTSLKTEGGRADMTIESKAVAHRIGECPAGSADNGQ